MSPSALAIARGKIRHVVVLMMENRSFDHVYGSLALEGRTDVDGLSMSMQNPRDDGTTASPFESDVLCVGDPPHNWNRSHAQWNEGKNDGFARQYAEVHGGAPDQSMGFFRGTTLSTSHAFADAGALCQRWFASVMGPTWPNRYYALLGTSHGTKTNDFIERNVSSIFDHLFNAGVSYANYHGNIPFGITLNTFSLEHPQVKPFEQFFVDAAAGALPSVTWLDPIYGLNDDHPPAHPLNGQILMSGIYDALAKSPHWNETLFVVTYDEHGGFFDHVPPPSVDDEHAADGFSQVGFRVPSVVLSPWLSTQVSDVAFDHTSIWKTVHELFDIGMPTTRIAAASSLLSLLDTEAMRSGTAQTAASLPVIVAQASDLERPECRGYRFHGDVDGIGTGQDAPTAQR
jgi:phospholipase C